MRIAEYSDSEEEEEQQQQQYGGAFGFDSSDDDEDDAPPPPPPPPNPHGVDEQNDFLSSDDSESDSDNERDPNEEDAIFDEHVETIREFVQPCPSMQTQGWATEFTFRSVEDDNRIEDVAQLVNVVLRKLIRDAKANALARGYQGGWIGVGWQSELMKNTFVIPYGHEAHNNPRKVLTAFEGFDQSPMENDLYGQIIRVQVTIVNAPPAGNARKSTKSLIAFGEQKDKADALLHIENKDNICLQRARELMTRCGTPLDLPTYGVDQLTPVQEYLNAHYADRYRLLVFSADHGEEDKPIFNGGVNAEKALVLWHEDGHFDAVKTVEKLFKPKKNNKYCPAC